MTGLGNKGTAAIVTALYVVFLAFSMLCVSVEIREYDSLKPQSILIEYVEKEEPPLEDVPIEEQLRETESSPLVVPSSSQTHGHAEQNRSVNPRALFQMNSQGEDHSVDSGNDKVLKGDSTTTKGDGQGRSLVGDSMLDAGLMNRGVVGDLPLPEFPNGSRGGRVVIRVSVDSSGRVTSAVFEPKGSTTSSSALISAAKRAALKARFQESKAMIEGGTITYFFKIR